MQLALGSVNTFTKPFPHFVIDGVLDGDFYNDLIENIPTFSGFDEADPSATGTLSVAEFCLLSKRHEMLGIVLNDCLLALNQEISGIYRALLAQIRDDEAYSSFNLLVENSNWEEPTYFRLRERGNGFKLPPHMDGPYFLGTHILYLARSAADARNGTTFFSPESPEGYDHLRGYLSMWPRHPRWRVAKHIEYRPNRLIGFLNTPYSTHGHAPFKLTERRLTINVTMKFVDESIRQAYERVPETHRRFFAKPKIIQAILNGVNTGAELDRDPEGPFSFLYG
jgi:hypothetical protein